MALSLARFTGRRRSGGKFQALTRHRPRDWRRRKHQVFSGKIARRARSCRNARPPSGVRRSRASAPTNRSGSPPATSAARRSTNQGTLASISGEVFCGSTAGSHDSPSTAALLTSAAMLVTSPAAERWAIHRLGPAPAMKEFGCQIGNSKDHPRDVAFGPAEAGDQAGSDRIEAGDEDDVLARHIARGQGVADRQGDELSTWLRKTGPPPKSSAPAPACTIVVKAALNSRSLAALTIRICRPRARPAASTLATQPRFPVGSAPTTRR